MPQRRRRHGNNRRQSDSCGFELFLFCLFLYLMVTQWESDCQFFFNSYCFTSYSLMIFIRKFQAATLDNIENNPKNQIIMIGILMPVFLVHTIIGGQEFFSADLYNCRKQYQGEVLYIIVFMFAVSMCFVFVLLLFCILLPLWVRKLNRRRRARQMADRIRGIDGLIDQNPLIEENQQQEDNDGQGRAD